MDRSIPRPRSTSRSSPRTLLDLATVAVQSRTDHGYSHADPEASERITLPPLSDVAYRARPRNTYWRSLPPPPATSAGTSTSQDLSGIPGQPLAPELGLHSVSTVSLVVPFTLTSIGEVLPILYKYRAKTHLVLSCSLRPRHRWKRTPSSICQPNIHRLPIQLIHPHVDSAKHRKCEREQQWCRRRRRQRRQ
jgi:hypothetical protein